MITANNHLLLTVIAVSLATACTRFFPYILLGNKKEIPSIVRYIGDVLPASIMVILVIYNISPISLNTYPYAMPEIISLLVVALIYKIRENTVLCIIGGTLSYMLCMKVIFKS